MKPDSYVELENLYRFLKNNPQIKIEISGHTDNTGSETHNKTLSENRAKSVYNYLINNGIEKSRLTFKGYGSSNPVNTNNTEKERQNNRRTEFKIL